MRVVEINKVVKKDGVEVMKSYSLRMSNPHPLSLFFKSRQVKFAQVADYLGVSRNSISTWLNGTKPIPEARDQQLWELSYLILDLEQITGSQFNGKELPK